jgi:Protein of unknown function (DUF2806)
MTSNTDRLSNEVSVTAKLEDKAISLKARSRFVSAVDRLLGSVADVPSSYLEGVSERLRLRNAQTIAHLKRIGKAEGELIDGILSNAVIMREIECSKNKRAIVENAIDHLDDVESDSEHDIEDEWLNSFERYASVATSERLRDIWGRVLAGEVHRPGSYSLTTLRFMSELDSQVAQKFEEVTRVRSIQGSILSPNNLSGSVFDDLNLLQEVGLLQHVGGFAHTKIFKQEDEFFYLAERDYALRISMKANTESEIKLPVIFITRIGREICSILPSSDDEAFLRSAAALFIDRAESVNLMKIMERNSDGSVHLLPYEVIK